MGQVMEFGALDSFLQFYTGGFDPDAGSALGASRFPGDRYFGEFYFRPSHSIAAHFLFRYLLLYGDLVIQDAEYAEQSGRSQSQHQATSPAEQSRGFLSKKGDYRQAGHDLVPHLSPIARLTSGFPVVGDEQVLLQTFLGPVQTSLNGSQGDIEKAGDIPQGAVLQVVQHHCATVFRGKPIQRFPQSAGHLVALEEFVLESSMVV